MARKKKNTAITAADNAIIAGNVIDLPGVGTVPDPQLTPGTAIVPLKGKLDAVEQARVEDGLKVLKELDETIASVAQTEAGLGPTYVKLGGLLEKVHDNEYFRLLDFDTFAKYMRAISDKYKKGRTQLYHYYSTVAYLKTANVTDAQLNQMGIMKAAALKKTAKQTNIVPDEQVIAAAVDPKTTVESLRKILFDKYRVPGEEPKGRWYDRLAEGFYADDEEKKVLDAAFEKALALGSVAESTPDWKKRKEVLMSWAQEFLSTEGQG